MKNRREKKKKKYNWKEIRNKGKNKKKCLWKIFKF